MNLQTGNFINALKTTDGHSPDLRFIRYPKLCRGGEILWKFWGNSVEIQGFVGLFRWRDRPSNTPTLPRYKFLSISVHELLHTYCHCV